MGAIIHTLVIKFNKQYYLNIFWINNTYLPIGAIWFLTALFFTSIIYFLIDRYIKNKYIKFISIILLTILGMNLKPTFDIQLPFSINQSLVGLFFIYLGHNLKAIKDTLVGKILFNKQILFDIILEIHCILIAIVMPVIDMRIDNYGNPICFILLASSEIILLFNIFNYIYEKTKNNKLIKQIVNIGKYSIYYLSFSQLITFLYFIEICKILFTYYSIDLSADYPHVSALSLFLLVLTIITCIILEKIINKTKLKYIFGK